MQEEWRDIPGLEGVFQVSNLGQVRSFTRKKKGYRSGVLKGGIIRPQVTEKGYLKVDFRYNNVRYIYKVHRLVMLVFMGVPQEGMTVNHKNGIKFDNRLENLEYMTQRENVRHAIEVLEIRYGTYMHKKMRIIRGELP